MSFTNSVSETVFGVLARPIGAVAVPPPTLEWDFLAQTLTDTSGTYTLAIFRPTANTASFHDSNGFIQFAAINAPRYDHDPTSFEFLGLLQEESRQSTVNAPEDLTAAAWTKNQVTIVANAETSPRNTATADRVMETAATSAHQLTGGAPATINVDNAVSIFIKAYAASAEPIFIKLNVWTAGLFSQWLYDPVTGILSVLGSSHTSTVKSFGSVSYRDGWFRIWMVQNAGAAGLSQIDMFLVHADLATTHAGNIAAGVYVWGGQSEPGTYPTSYMAGLVARQGDSISLTPIAAFDAPAASSWMLQARKGLTGSASWYPKESSFLVSVSNNAAAPFENYWLLNRNPLTPTFTIAGVQASVNQFSATNVAAQVEGVEKFAFAFNSNPVVEGASGGNATSRDTAGTIPTALTHLYVGGNSRGGVQGAQHLQNLQFWDSKLSQSQLNKVTR